MKLISSISFTLLNGVLYLWQVTIYTPEPEYIYNTECKCVCLINISCLHVHKR